MRFMQGFLRPLLAGMALSLLACSSSAFAAAPANGAGYIMLDRPQSTEANGKIEVLEFFSYHCPHCFALDPMLNDWVKKHKDEIVFKRVHVSWGEPGSATEKMMSALQRAFYTLDAMGKEEELHGKIFNAFHVERQPLYTENAVVDFLAKNGIDRQKYLATANSFAMQSKTQRAKQQYINYGVDRIGVPTLVVDGRFITSPGTASKGPNASEQENGASALHVMDQLLARIAAERGTAVAAPQKK